MRFFIDTANVDEIKEAHSWGAIDGVTTNPSLVAKEGKDFREILDEICSIIDGPISAETVTLNHEEIIAESRELAKIHKNIVVKIPLIKEGLKAVQIVSKEGINTNVTLCFSATQALMAAKAGATYISPFIGRLDDISQDGMALIEDIRDIYDNYDFPTQILTASVRHPEHVRLAALVGSDVATIPFGVLEKLIKHPLTDSGLDKFLKDWETVPKLTSTSQKG